MSDANVKRRRWAVLLTALLLSLAPTLLFRDRYRLLPFETILPVLLLIGAVAVVIAVLQRRLGRLPWPVILIIPALLTFLDFYTITSLVNLALSNSPDLRGANLLGATATAWSQNTVCFGLWYYIIDREVDEDHSRDLAFPDGARGNRTFIDYLYVAATTGLAFSATDTAPLTTRMRLVMLCNGLSAFLLVALAAAKALNAL